MNPNIQFITLINRFKFTKNLTFFYSLISNKDMSLKESTLILKNHISELNYLFQHIKNFCKKHKLNKKTQMDIQLVLEECFINIISHAYENKNNQSIEIDISYVKGHVDIKIKDNGKAFNPLTDAPPLLKAKNIKEQVIGGFGLHLIKHKSKPISYKRKNDQNCLNLSIYVDKK